MKKMISHIALFCLCIVALLPLRVLYVVSDATYFLLYYIIRYRRKVVRTNLINSFPEKTEAEIRSIERKFYLHLCDCIYETIKLLHISDKEMRKRAVIVNAELVEKIAATGKPIILFIAHYGNWEWVQEITLRYKYPKTNVAVYKKIHNPISAKVVEKMRLRYASSCIIIPQAETLRTILKLKQQGEPFVAGLIADQRPPRFHQKLWITFLNQHTPLLTGGEDIGKRIGAHFLYLDVDKTRRGHYTMEFKDISTDESIEEYPYTIGYFRMLEQSIRRRPELWLWSHKRWKYAVTNPQ
ncbi:MAG: lysophospholipid acyltransferase family protein [Prevotellaceae bacterium]|nr:lysophospholipid acyltransferase family protein [Prevotellaceae bacterium]